MLGVVLPLLSSACWGTADFYGGLLSRRLRTLTVVVLSQLIGGLVVLALALVLREPWPSSLWLPLLGGAIGAVGLLLFYGGLAVGTMSIVAPIAACGSVLPVAFSIAIGQVPRPLVMVGLASALVGVVLASLGHDADGEAPPNKRPRRAVAAAVGAAFCFGVFLLALGRASVEAPSSQVWLTAAARAGSVPTLVLIAMVMRVPLVGTRLQARDVLAMGAVGLGDVTANTLFLFATSVGSLAVAAVLASLYPIGTVLLARLVLKERVGRVQGTGAALALLGVVLVSAG